MDTILHILASLPSTMSDIPLHRLLLSGLTHNDAKWNGKYFPGLLDRPRVEAEKAQNYTKISRVFCWADWICCFFSNFSVFYDSISRQIRIHFCQSSGCDVFSGASFRVTFLSANLAVIATSLSSSAWSCSSSGFTHLSQQFSWCLPWNMGILHADMLVYQSVSGY